MAKQNLPKKAEDTNQQSEPRGAINPSKTAVGSADWAIEAIPELLAVGFASLIVGSQGKTATDLNKLKSYAGKKGSTIFDNVSDIAESSQTLAGHLNDIAVTLNKISDKLVSKSKGPAAGGQEGKFVTVRMGADNDNMAKFITALGDLDKNIVEKIDGIAEGLNKLNTVDTSNFVKQQESVNAAMSNMNSNLSSVNDFASNYAKTAETMSATVGKAGDLIKTASAGLGDAIKTANTLISKEEIKQFADNSVQLAAAVSIAGATMLIGAAILSKHPELPVYVMQFTELLAQFLTGILLPIAMANVIATMAEGGSMNFGKIGGFIAISSMVMFIGAALILNFPQLVDASFKFLGVLATFIGTVGVICALVSVVGGLSKGSTSIFEDIGNLMIKSAAIMTIGALFVLYKGGAFAKSALVFGLVLSAFIGIVLFAFILTAPLNLIAAPLAKSFGDLVVKCALIMSIGAWFVMLGGGAFIRGAIVFALLLGVFMNVTLTSIVVQAALLTLAAPLLKAFAKLLVTAAIVMTIGALLVWLGGGKFVVAALAFTIVLGLFLGGTLAAIALAVRAGGRDMKWYFATIFAMGYVIKQAAFAMLIGSLFLLWGGPKAFVAALAFSGVLGLFLFGVITAVKYAIKNITQKDITTWMGITRLIKSTAMILILGGWFMSDKKRAAGALEFGVLFSAFIFAIVGVFMFAKGKLSGAEKTFRQIEIFCAIMTPILLLGGWFMSDRKRANGAWEYAGLLLAVTVVFTAIFAVIGYPAIAALVAKGAKTALGIALGIGALGIAVGIVAITGQLLEKVSWEALGKFAATVAVFAVVFGIIGIEPIALAVAIGSAVAVAMSIGLWALSKAIAVMADIAVILNEIPNEALSKLAVVVLAIAGIFATMGVVSPLIALGSIAVYMMAPALTMLGESIKILSGAVSAAANISDKEVKRTIGLLNSVFSLDPKSGILGALIKASPKLLLAGFISFQMMAAMLPLCITLRVMGSTIADLSQLKVVEGFDKDGNITGYRQLKTSDFQNAATAISAMITCIGDAIVDVYNKDTNGIFAPQSVHDMLFGIDTPFTRVVKSMQGTTKLLSGIASVVKGFACMQIADKWDKEGNPIHWRVLDQSELDKAKDTIAGTANNPGLLTAIIDAIISAIDIMGKTSVTIDGESTTMLNLLLDGCDGFLGIGAHDSSFGKIIGGLMGVTELLSSAGKVISDFAVLAIPSDFDSKTGEPKKWVKLNAASFEQVKTNMAMILKALPEGIIQFIQENPTAVKYFQEADAWYAGIFGEKDPEKGSFIQVVSGLQAISGIMGDVVDTLLKLAGGAIPTGFDAEGKATGYTKFTIEDAKSLALNIGDILGALPLGIAGWIQKSGAIGSKTAGGMTKIKLGKSEYTVISLFEEDNDFFVYFQNGIRVISEMIAIASKAIVDFASLKVPTGFDAEGKATGYSKLDNTLIKSANINIENLLCGFVEAAAWGFKTFDSYMNEIDIDKTGPAMEAAMGKVSKIIGIISQAIVDFSSLQFPIIDANGKEKGKETLTLDKINTANEAIEALLTGIPVAFAIGSNSWDDDLANRCDSVIDAIPHVQNAINELSKLTVDVASTTDLSVLHKNLMAFDGYAAIIASISALFSKKPKSTSQQSNDNMFFAAARSLNNFAADLLGTNYSPSVVENKMNSFTKVMNQLAKINVMVKGSDPRMFGIVAYGIHAINKSIEEIDNKNYIDFYIQIDEVQTYIKAINQLKVGQASTLVNLIRELNKLAGHVGNLDEFTRVLAEKVSLVLDRLTNEIKAARFVIHHADRIQQQRHELIDKSIARVETMMNNTLKIEVKQSEDGVGVTETT